MNIASYIDRTVREFPDRIAFRINDSETTYGELNSKARSLAGYFHTNGFQKGDKVGVLMPNCPDYLITLYATWILGGVAVPINYRFKAEELHFVFKDSGIKWLVTFSDDYSSLEKPMESLPNLQIVTQGKVSQLPSLSTIYRTGAVYTETKAMLDSEDALLMYTSGTTGNPKGVRQTHRSNTASIDMVIDIWKLTLNDHLLATVPLFHVGGLQCSTLPTLFTGGIITFLPKWNATAWLELTRKHKPTWSGMVSTMMVDLVNYLKSDGVEKDAFESLRFCMFGGSPTPEPVLNYFEEKTGVHLLELYGQTETSGLMITYSVGERRRKRSIGRLMNQVVEGKIIAPDGKLIEPGSEEVGELYLKGDVVTPGYWNNETLNEERFVDGWIKTGDVVSWDQDSYLYYTDRMDDMIITGGENVSPKEVEDILAKHPKIAEIAVIGTPHERWIEQVTAIIVSSDKSLSAGEIEEYIRDNDQLSHYKRPRRIEFVNELPKTGSGKLNKNLLKQLYARA